MLIRLLRSYLQPYTREVAIVIVLVLVQSIANLYLPNLNADIINNGVAKGDIPYIWRTGAVTLSGLLVVVIPILIAIVAFTFVKAIPLFRSMQVKIDRINQVLREQIMGVRVIRAFIRTDYESRRFESANYDLTSTALRVNRIFVIAFPAVLAVMNLTTIAVLWFGGHLVDSGQMPIGNMTAFLMYIMQILMSLVMAISMVILVPRAEASAAPMHEVVTTTPSIEDPANAVRPLTLTGAVDFESVP